ncbi:MAG: type II methionyl aminopeptidase [archaeon]
MDLEKLEKAGKIASELRAYVKTLAKANTPLLEIADAVEKKTAALGAKPAFPINISINNVAAHHTPLFTEKLVLKDGDLVKFDIGVHIDGNIADTAVSVSIGKDAENEELIKAAEAALAAAVRIAVPGTELREIGAAVDKAITDAGFNPIKNLTGHLIDEYDLHAGISIPNFDNKDKTKLEKDMIIAIEPFATNSTGYVNEGDEVEIFKLAKSGNVRMGRDILDYVAGEFDVLPFAKRWLVKRFGEMKTNLFLKEAVTKGILHPYHILIESSGTKVAQAEHTVLVADKPVILTK